MRCSERHSALRWQAIFRAWMGPRTAVTGTTLSNHTYTCFQAAFDRRISWSATGGLRPFRVLQHSSVLQGAPLTTMSRWDHIRCTRTTWNALKPTTQALAVLPCYTCHTALGGSWGPSNSLVYLTSMVKLTSSPSASDGAKHAYSARLWSKMYAVHAQLTSRQCCAAFGCRCCHCRSQC